MANLSVSDFGFSYGPREVLHNINFEANAGDFVAVVGPNGVGKSTMFRCILGFMNGYKGTILVDGKNARDMSRKEFAKCIAYIPQSSEQVFNYTVLELVMMGMAIRLKLFATPGKEEEEMAMDALAQLGISHLAHQGCGEISGGEYQLVLLARALVQKSKILVMDEPTANLDYGNQYRVMDRIAGLTRNDFIILMSSHDPNQVLLHASKALVIKDGTVAAFGKPGEVLDNAMLSSLYGIEVHRHTINDFGREVDICVPGGLYEEMPEVQGIHRDADKAGSGFHHSEA